MVLFTIAPRSIVSVRPSGGQVVDAQLRKPPLFQTDWRCCGILNMGRKSLCRWNYCTSVRKRPTRAHPWRVCDTGRGFPRRKAILLVAEPAGVRCTRRVILTRRVTRERSNMLSERQPLPLLLQTVDGKTETFSYYC